MADHPNMPDPVAREQEGKGWNFAEVPDSGTDKSSGDRSVRKHIEANEYAGSSMGSTPVEGRAQPERPISPAVLRFIELAGSSSGSGSSSGGGIPIDGAKASGGPVDSGGSGSHSSADSSDSGPHADASDASNAGGKDEPKSAVPLPEASADPDDAVDGATPQAQVTKASLVLGAAIPVPDSGAETPTATQPADSGAVQPDGTNDTDAMAPAQDKADPPRTRGDRLPVAANAWHGVDAAEAVSPRLPHTDGTPLGHDIHTPDGSYVLKPQVVHTSEGDRVVYYNAWNPHIRRVELVVGPGDLDAFLNGNGASGSPNAPNRQLRGRGVPATDHGTARLDAPEKLLTTARAELRAMRERAEAAHPRASQKQKATWTFSVCKVVTPDGRVTASSEGAFYGGKARHAEQVALGKLDRSAIRPQDTVIVFTEQFACQERCVPYIERWQKSVNGGLRVYSEATRVTQTHPDGTKEDVTSGAKSTALKAGSRSEIVEDLSLRKSAAQPNNQDFHAPRHSPVGGGKPKTPRSVPPALEIVYPTRETTRSSAIEGLGMWLNQTQAKLSGEHEQAKLEAAVKALRPQIDDARRAGKYVVLNVTVDQPRVEDLGSSIFTTPDQLRYLVGVTMTTGDTREEAMNPPMAWEPGRPRDQQTEPVRVPPGRTDPRKWVTYPIVMEPIPR